MSDPVKEKNIDGENLNPPENLNPAEESKADKKKAEQLKKKEAAEKVATEKVATVTAAEKLATETAAGKKDVAKEAAVEKATEKKATDDEANISHPSIHLSRLIEEPIQVEPTEIVIIKRKPREPSPDSDDEGTSHPNLRNKNIKKPINHPNIDRSRIRLSQDIVAPAKQTKCKEIHCDPCDQMEDFEGHPNVRHTKSKSANHPNHRCQKPPRIPFQKSSPKITKKSSSAPKKSGCPAMDKSSNTIPTLDVSPDTVDKCPETSSKPCGSSHPNKKYLKIKFEIDQQNYVVEKLNYEIILKTKCCESEDKLCIMKKNLNREIEKLKEMYRYAMVEQRMCKNEKWGPISVSAIDEVQIVSNNSPQQACGKKPRFPKVPSNISDVSGFSKLELSESLLSNNECLEDDKFKLQNELLCKDHHVQELQANLHMTQCEMAKLCRENMAMARKLENPDPCQKPVKCCSDVEFRLKYYKENTDKLECNISQMDTALKKLKCELEAVKKDKVPKCPCELSPSCPPAPKTDPNKNLKVQYSNLMNEYCKKDAECTQMTERLKKTMIDCNDKKDQVENEFLKKRCEDLAKEVCDFKVFMKELQCQVDLYRDKFLAAQEKVEEQRYVMENLELNNQRIEEQVNDEISRIKAKFQEKLAELCPYPQKLNEARLDLENSNLKVTQLQAELKATVAALCKTRCELKTLREEPDDSIAKKYQKLLCEVEMLKKKYCDIKSTKECLEEKLLAMRGELEELRKDSTKIISTTKCCSDKNRKILHEHINCLEIDLAQSRAAATLSLTDKEQKIKSLQHELNSLCSCFNDAQSQIQQLKNHVSYLTNQKHKIRPEDLNKIDYCLN
ncbi:unnamed protein product [Diamesa hyperborea]